MRQQPLLRNIWFTDAGGESGRNFTVKKKDSQDRTRRKLNILHSEKLQRECMGKQEMFLSKTDQEKNGCTEIIFFILLPLLKNKLTVPRGRSIRKVMGGGGGDIHFAGIFFTQCLLSF